jgi:hypothetical protein
MIDNPQVQGYRWAFHPGKGFNYRIHKENGKESIYGI